MLQLCDRLLTQQATLIQQTLTTLIRQITSNSNVVISIAAQIHSSIQQFVLLKSRTIYSPIIPVFGKVNSQNPPKLEKLKDNPHRIATFISKLSNIKPSILKRIQTIPLFEDFRMILVRDPAARNWLEVLCCYPGFHAIICHRFAHWLHCQNVPFFPRLISYLGRFLTGVEIHPAATLGKGIVIDHGIGVVIGETAIIGDYTLIYQEVTLGGTGKEIGKRHPTVGNHVVIGAGAKVLGNIQIGDYARIGAGSIVLRDVPAHCTAVGVPGRNLCHANTQDCPLKHGQTPDPEALIIRTLVDRIEQLEQKLQALETANLISSPDLKKCNHLLVPISQ